jgi:hypothetical protein
MGKLTVLQDWDYNAKEAAKLKPLKTLEKMPKMVGITPDTARFLKWKSLYWMIKKDKNFQIMRHVLKKPFKHGLNYFKSLFSPLKNDGDFYLYGIKSVDEIKNLFENDPIFVVGFSYCHKPLECPSGRFTDKCVADPENLVCRQCFIGKAVHHLPEADTRPLFIPTIHYIGEEIFKVIEEHPKRQIIFMITACEMTLKMFGDWGNLAGIQGLGVRLDGRICNTMKAFELSEEGIKPGLTVVLEPTQNKMIEILNHWRARKTNS